MKESEGRRKRGREGGREGEREGWPSKGMKYMQLKAIRADDNILSVLPSAAIVLWQLRNGPWGLPAEPRYLQHYKSPLYSAR